MASEFGVDSAGYFPLRALHRGQMDGHTDSQIDRHTSTHAHTITAVKAAFHGTDTDIL